VTLRPTWLHRDRATSGPTLDEAFRAARPTLVDDRATLSADELEAAAAGLAGSLRALGVERGSTVAWQSANRWEIVALYRACWRLGAIAAPIHHLAGAAEVDALVTRLAPAAVIDPDDIASMAERGDPVHDGVAAPEDLALVLHTSGSSGEPKGALHTQAGLAFKAALMIRVHGLQPDDVVLMPAPLAHISGLLNSVTIPGVGGMKAILMARWDPEHALALIEEHGVTMMMGPPTFFVGLRDTPGFTPERVRTVRLISCGGAGVTPAFVEDTTEVFGAVVKRTYGSTEAPTVTTGHTGDDPVRLRETDGRPTGDAQIRLGPSDEIWVRAPELFVGYTDPARTAEAIGVDDDGAEWFRTGDVGRIDDEGWLTVTGRIKDVIIRGGENISAAEVESALEAHPSVRQAVAVGRPDQRLGEKVCAYVVCVPGGRFDLETCREWFQDRGLAKFKTPERVVVLAEMPVLAAGKIDRTTLRKRAAQE
jgi:cyclohexanecarboxylate-CoA ligase